MADEVREVEIRVQANQAIRSLATLATNLDNNNRLVGQTNAELRRAESAMERAANAARTAAQTIVGMKAALATAKAETTAAEAATAKMATTLERSSRAHEETKVKLQSANATMKQMRAEILQLRTANEGLVKANERLQVGIQGIREDFVKYKQTINQADEGLLRFGASATTTLARLKSLETQMNAVQGKQLSMLNIPATLGGAGSAAGAIRNPDVNAIRNMTNQQLSQINRAYDVMGQTLQQTVQRQLQDNLARQGFKMTGEQLEFSNALRYQLYDLVGVFGTVGVAATGLSVAFLSVGIAWEKNFANVERTSQTVGGAVEKLREDFLRLQSTLPVTSEELAKIGTLGAQMGVSAVNLSKFTEVTAQFAATSGLGVEEAATALSRLDELLPDVEGNYVRLASAILKTGVNAVATEQQIVRGTSQIAAMGQIAGFTTPEVVALSSAMSSLGFSPELQRSIVTSSFSKIMLATAQVTEKTEAYGKVLGMTGKQFQTAWRSDALGTYRDLLQEIGNRGDAVTILNDLGLASQRLTPNLLKLGQNVDVLDQALADTQQGWREQTELSRQYGIISQTVAARLQVLGQSWEALMVTLNDSDGVIGSIIDGLTNFIRFLRDLSKNPAASAMVTMAAALGLVVGVLAIGLSAVALFTAGYIAMANATIGLNTALLTNDKSVAGNTVALQLNTTEVAENAAARLGLGAPLLLENAAVDKNTTSHLKNGQAVRNGAINAIGFSSRILGAIPTLLGWASAIGIGAIALTGLIALMQESGTMAYDLGKTLNGIDTPKETVNYDVGNIKQALKDARDVRRAMEQEGRRTGPGLNVDMSSRFKNVDFAEVQVRKADEAWKSLSKTILGLGSVEEQYAALNAVSADLGMTQGELLRKLPDVSNALGDNAEAAAMAQEEIEQLSQAQELWAAMLGSNLDEVGALSEGLKGAAQSFFDFGGMIKDAWADAKIENEDGELIPNDAFDSGAAWLSFTSGLNTRIADYQTFIDSLGDLTARGGVNLAAEFAAMGPESMGALTEALKMSDADLAVVEGNMRLAAFYASDAFANAFVQSNAILSAVLQATGDPAVVAQVSELMSRILKPGEKLTVEDIIAIESLAPGLIIPAAVVPEVDPYKLEEARIIAEATVREIKVPLNVTGPDGLPLFETLTQWRVEENGKALLLNVDPNTEEGRRIVANWRAQENKNPVTVFTSVRTSQADEALRQFRLRNNSLTVDVRPNFTGSAINGRSLIATVRKDGGIIDGRGTFRSLPAFATGGGYGQFQGPGTGTSDSILARVSNGEYINTARAVRYYGSQLFDDLNRMRIPRFATGGMIGGAAAGGAGTVVNATVNQYYPTTQDPIRKLKEDAEAVIAGIWT